jgi:hypothetical protein
MQQYKKIIAEELNFVYEWPVKPLGVIQPKVVLRFDKHYASLTDKFFRWARTLPNYDEETMYKITLLP